MIAGSHSLPRVCVAQALLPAASTFVSTSVPARLLEAPRASVLVLAVGNLLLGDDAVGLQLATLLQHQDAFPSVEIQDGGTQGIALLPWLSDREVVIILDAVSLGAPPGTVHILRGDDLGRLRARRASSAHEGNALELLETARLLGEHTGEVVVIGIEPESVRTGIGLTSAVEAAIPAAMHELVGILGQWR